jgi:hypothetical protein
LNERLVGFHQRSGVLDADYFETHDTNGALRNGIKFSLRGWGLHFHVQPELCTMAAGAAESPMDYGINLPNETERKGLVNSRVGHGAYRKRIIHRWEYK